MLVGDLRGEIPLAHARLYEREDGVKHLARQRLGLGDSVDLSVRLGRDRGREELRDRDEPGLREVVLVLAESRDRQTIGLDHHAVRFVQQAQVAHLLRQPPRRDVDLGPLHLLGGLRAVATVRHQVRLRRRHHEESVRTGKPHGPPNVVGVRDEGCCGARLRRQLADLVEAGRHERVE